MNYIPYKTKFIREKLTTNTKLDEYLVNIGFDKELTELLKNPPKENDYHLLHDLDKMVIEMKSLPKDTVFTIVGDYDADGCTSTAILYLGLTKVGFPVHYYIPHRIQNGYGISEKIVDKINEEYPDTKIIITCDNGIAASDAIKYAKSKGYKVYLTDHHTPNFDNLPNADYIIHPALPGYPFAEISGATVAYKVVQALIEVFEIDDIELSEYILQLAAISVVSDVMPVGHKDISIMQVNENRTILQKGITLMRERPNWRLKLMFNMFKIQGETLDETTIGFYIAPVINAVGRLDNAAEAVAFLIAQTNDIAILKCSIMGYLNEERKELKNKSLKEVKETLDDTKASIIIKSKELHEGIVGIIAGNLADQYQKPSIVFSQCEIDGNVAWKASGRSIEGVNLYELLSSIKNDNSDLIYKFGGHAGAAGLTVLDKYILNFENAFNDKVEALGKIETKKYYLFINANDIAEFAKALVEIKPLGNGLPKPVIRIPDMVINQYDFFFGSSHVKLSNRSRNEFWLYGALESFMSIPTHLVDFSKTKDNTEKKMETLKISRLEAKKSRWERWETKHSNKPTYEIICEVDYGNFMNSIGPIFSVLEYSRNS